MSRATLAATAVLIASVSGAAHGQTADFRTQEGSDNWRASKLSGVAIFGPDNKKVGSISDVLMDHNGKASAIVIGVGGFLGLGQKDVAVPFDQVKFTDQPMVGSPGSSIAPGGDPAAAVNGAASPATTALGMPADTTGNPNAPMASGAAPGTTGALGAAANDTANGVAAPSTQGTPGMGTEGAPAAGAPPILGTPAATTTGTAAPGAIGMAAVPTGPAAVAIRTTSYPDHGTIDLTADQLKAAPSFQFAK